MDWLCLSNGPPELFRHWCRYSALKSLGEKKACFNEYTQQRKKDEVLERRLALKKAREDFNTMLEECVDLSVGMRLSKAAQILEDDPRWKVCLGFPHLLRAGAARSECTHTYRTKDF